MTNRVPCSFFQKCTEIIKRVKGKQFLAMIFSLICWTAVQSQHPQGPAKKIGPVGEFSGKLRVTSGQGNARTTPDKNIPTSDAIVAAFINIEKTENGEDVLIGGVKGSRNSNVYFTINNGILNGQVVLPEEEKAYQYSTETDGNVYVQEVDIHTVMCVQYLAAEEEAAAGEDFPMAVPPASSSVYTLQSLPGATAVAYLDFDGEYVSGSRWNSGNPINALAGNFSEANIRAIWNMISEDFRPFNINITTDVAIFNAAPVRRRIRCIFTPTNTASPGAGGVAYLNSFSANRNDPCWVFNSGVKSAGEAGSHEIGHTLGLSHDATSSQSYYGGHGIWGPIMGASYSRALVQWSIGEYPNANQTQNDVSIIANTTNGFGYRTDEAGSTNATAKALVIEANGTVTGSANYGIITQRTDIDVYSFTTSGGSVTLTVNPAPAYPNLDILLKLLDAAGNEITTANPNTSGSGTSATALSGLNATITRSLAAGTYYLHIDGTGQGNTTTGYSDYGSLGEYTISGTVPATVNQLPTVSITSPANNATFNAPASVTINANASDPDGNVTKVEFFNGATKLGEDMSSPYTYNWTSVAAGTYTLTAVATDNEGASSTSSAVTVVVNANTPPTVTLTEPANNSTYIAPANISLTATATDAGGSVAKVEFFNGATKLGEDATSPYSYNWTNVSAGTYTVTARATDNAGLTATSGPITITVNNNQAPVVVIISPDDNSNYSAPASITIEAMASDPDGSVSKVEFYNGTAKLGEDLSNPYSFTWSSVPAGSYGITVRATDNLGATGSATITLDVNVISGLHDAGLLADKALYPNPTSGTFYIPKDQIKPDLLKIIDARGAEVRTILSPEEMVDISELQPGIYTVLMFEGTGRFYFRVFKD